MAKYLFDGHKLLYHMDRVYTHYRDGKRIYPLHIDLGATKICQAKCIYCYGIKQKMTNSIIPRKQLLNIFGTARSLGIVSLTVTGDGEPTLNKHIYEAVSVGYHSGLDIGFATNGIALSIEQLKILLQSCIWIRFNLSAVDRDVYKKIHGVDRWNTVRENIKLAISLKRTYGYKCTLGLQMVLIPQCIDQVIPETKFAVAEGLDYFVIKQFSDPGCEEMSTFSLNWYDDKGVGEILATAEAASTLATKIVPKWGMIKSKGIRPYDRCVDCAVLFQISGSGRCYPCGYLFGDNRYCYGDLHKQTLKEILDSDRYWEVVRHMREEFDVHTQCKGCCRHDFTNKFVWEYLNPPDHINFI